MWNNIKRLNWRGFIVILILSMAAAATNKHVDDIYNWIGIVVFIGLPAATFFLITGRKEK
jgi:hypothetical protein